MKAINVIISKWYEIRFFMRRYPWPDWILGFVILWWGMDATFFPDLVLFHSHFGSLNSGIVVVGPVISFVGVYQIFSFLISRKARTIAAFFGFWAVLSLWFTVDSVTGKDAWGGYVVEELLICLAIV